MRPGLALVLSGLVACATVARRPIAKPPAAAFERAARVGDLLGRASTLAKDLTGGMPRGRPIIVNDQRFSLLLGAAPSNGFVPLNGSDCPCWREGAFPVVGEAFGQIWILDEGKEWQPTSKEEAKIFANRPGALEAMVVSLLDWSRAWQSEFLEAFFRQALDAEPPPFWTDASLKLSLENPEARRKGTWLLEEQALLARALRAPSGSRHRWMAIDDWVAAREYLARERLLPDGERPAELSEGKKGFLTLESLLGGTAGPEALEHRVARTLELGGRDLWPEAWFGEMRAGAVGVALVMLLRDAGEELGSFSIRAGLDGALEAVATCRRRPGGVREALRDPEDVRADLEAREPLPSFLPMPRVDYERALASLEGQARVQVRIENVNDYEWTVAPLRIHEAGKGVFAIGIVAARGSDRSVGWSGLLANRMEESGERAQWFELYDFAGRPGKDLPSPRLELTRAGKLRKLPGGHWLLSLPSVEAPR